MGEQLHGYFLRQRQDMYLANHYTTLHVTIVGLTLGVAGVVASSLLAGPPSTSFEPYQPVFGILWLASLLCVAVAYGGPMIANILMPARIPSMMDFLLPLMVAVCEFILFTVLGYRITGWTSPRAVLAAWWFTLAAFCLAAVLQTRRARYLINADSYTDAGDTINHYRRHLGSNLNGATAVMVLGLVGGAFSLLRFRWMLDVSYGLAALVVVPLIVAIDEHRKTANELRRDFTLLPSKPPEANPE